MDENTVTVEQNEFNKSFKYYKSRNPPPDLTNVIDFLQPEKHQDLIIPYSLDTSELVPACSISGIGMWKAFTLRDREGFIFITNPFTLEGQKYWIKRCLKDFTKKPNYTNLDGNINDIGSVGDIFRASISNMHQKRVLLDKLRWATVGYHHNWNTKMYSTDAQSPMPDDLVTLCGYIARAVGFKEYKAEAAIINFYPLRSTLAGHTDHSEFDHISPIVSISFGCSAVFLLGGATKTTPPTPIFINSGDIVIMSASCRLSYHAVPLIVPRSCGLDLSPASAPCCRCVEMNHCNASGASGDKCECDIRIINSDVGESADFVNFPTGSADTDEENITAKSCTNTSYETKLGSSCVSCMSCVENEHEPLLSCKTRTLAECNHACYRCCENCDCKSDRQCWEFIKRYLLNSRININVRQVFPNE